MKKLLQNGEEVLPQIFLFSEENAKRIITPLIGIGHFFASKEGKRQIPSLVKNVWFSMKASKPNLQLIAIVMLSDSWVEDVSYEEGMELMRNGRNTPFEPKIGMSEALIIQVSDANDEVVYELRYRRSRAGIEFDKERSETKNQGGPQGLLMSMWPL